MFKTLPIAAEINGGKMNKYLCMHGGISPSMKSKDDINAAKRFIEP
jgi:diadenosine tetraphosphatase ApaH/serine/threonine PP2A family protein phosphatase